ncbi:MAG: Gldg family protein [Treponema sp.]|nr:Gldg family protein [Treponema sp.]
MKKFLNWLKGPSSDFLLFLVLLVLLNIFGKNAYFRIDLTKPKSYSLSKASVDIVKNLEEPLSVRVFFDKNLPSPYNSVAQYVEDFLEEYKNAANNNFSLYFMDVSKDSNVQLARDFGLHQVQIQEVKNNEVGFKQSYMGVVISYGGSVELIDPISSTDGFEYKLTSTISKMINEADSLAGLKGDEKIKVTVYLSEALKNLRIDGVEQMESIVETAYRNVNNQSQNRLEYTIIHPKADEVSDLIDRYALQGLSYSANGKRETGVLGVLIEKGENFRVLPIQVQQSIFGYMVSGLEDVEVSIKENIQTLLSKPTEIGYILGHNELPLDEAKYAANFDKLVSGMYRLVELDLAEQDIPANMTCIVINGPQFDYTEEELYKVDQFIMKGGNAMFLIDGMNTTGSASYYTGTPQYQKNNINIDRLLSKYGVERGKNFVMDKECYSQVNQQYGKLNLYWAPILQKDRLAKNHPITNNLGYVVMLQNSTLDVSAAQANKDVNVTILARSSDKSWVVDKEDTLLNPMMISEPSDPSVFKSENMAVLLEGKFESAFDEAPEPEYDEDEEDEDGNPIARPMKMDGDITANNHISKSKLPGKIFVAGTSYITTYQVLDEKGTSPVAMFMMNVVDYLNGNEELCVMRTKGLSLNTLTVKSQTAAKLVQYFNEYGLAVLVAIAGFIVWRLRSKRRVRINRKYNPDDTRFKPTKAKKETKEEEN